MGAIRHLRGRHFSSPAQPISLLEFSNVLFSTWRNRKSGVHANTFGLAISGGVDSMALAVLCSKLLRDNGRRIASAVPDLRFQAFVVDHGVRKGSDEEAIAVSKVLASRGIPTQVLSIGWKTNETPAKLSNFESLARKYRFQALGKACRQFGIDSLFLAHHEDDQAETLFMRMINGHRMLGLSGMKSESEIPECRGLHGVHESGGLDAYLSFTLERGIRQTQLNFLQPLPIEKGGVRIYRPLLGFNKSRLIATCEAEKMEWFEDHTNHDPRITVRNAVRYMLRSRETPVALRATSLVDLSKKAQLQRNQLDAIANGLMREKSVMNLDTRTGTLRVRFPILNEDNLPPGTCKNCGLIAALLVRQIILFVTPEEYVPLSTLHGTVKHVFPEISKLHEKALRPAGFIVSGVRFQLLTSQRHEDGASSSKCEWLISRRPYPASLKLPLICIPPSVDSSIETRWSAWQLYDGRFWIRLQNRGTTPIIVRPFWKGDLKDFKQALSLEEGNQELQALLKRFAPGDVRWTLPAIVTEEAGGSGRVLALPTLGIGVPGIKKLINWEVRYKQVDAGNLPSNTHEQKSTISRF